MKNENLKNKMKNLASSFKSDGDEQAKDFEILKSGDANHISGGTDKATCGALTKCGWNSDTCPKLTSCDWNG